MAGTDFERITSARKLSATAFTIHKQLGYITLQRKLQNDEALAVAFEYTYNGRVYKVGELTEDYSSLADREVIFLKLLRPRKINIKDRAGKIIPTWDLMMKNVYYLKTKDGSILTSIQPGDFKLNVLYEQPSLGQKRYLPEGDKQGVPLITLLNLDRLNSRNDPLPDGVFDYLEGYTILSQQARIVFPVLEPFGRDLEEIAFNTSTREIKDKYLYYQLYDTIKEIAKTYANLDRYIISGSAKGQSSSEISLGAFNVPPGSVTIRAEIGRAHV